MVQSLNVTSKTSLAELQRFTNDIGDASRLRGKKLPDGSIQLYAKDNKPGLWNRLTGNPRSNARQAVNTVLKNHERTMGGKTLDNVRTALNTGIKSRDIKGDALKALVRASDRTVTKGKDESGDDIDIMMSRNPGPGLAKLPAGMKQDLLGAIDRFVAEASARGDIPLSEHGEALGDKFATVFDSAVNAAPAGSADAKNLEKLSLSNGNALKYDLREAIAERYPVLAGDTGRQILDFAFRSAEASLFKDKQLPDGKLSIGGETYRSVGKLAEGGFGAVHRYECVSDTSKPDLAIKTLIMPSDADDSEKSTKLQEIKREVQTHRSAQGGGHANVIGYESAVAMNDGTMAVALELAPHGSALDAADKIGAAVAGGQISPQDAMAMRLTLIKDMADGQAQLQRAGKGIIHFDFKNPNVFIGEGGVAKVGDFGLSAQERHFDIATVALPDQPSQVAPEVLAGKSDWKAATGSAQERSNAQAANANAVRDRFKGLDDTQRSSLLADANFAESTNITRERADVNLNAAETWSFGSAAFQLVFGRAVNEDPKGAAFKAPVEARMIAFSNSGGTAIDTSRRDTSAAPNSWLHAKQGSFAGSTGNDGLDTLFNAMLHPDPEQRPSMGTIAGNTVFQNASVGSQRSRDLIEAVMTGNATQLQALTGLQGNQPAPAPANTGAPVPPQNAQATGAAAPPPGTQTQTAPAPQTTASTPISSGTTTADVSPATVSARGTPDSYAEPASVSQATIPAQGTGGMASGTVPQATVGATPAGSFRDRGLSLDLENERFFSSIRG